LKKRPNRRRRLLLPLAALGALLLAIPAALVGLASLPEPPRRGEVPPRVELVARGQGALRAGAAAVPFDLPAGTPIGGFGRLSYESSGVRDRTGARAVVVEAPGCRVALVSAELVLVPEALEEAVRARLSDVPLDGLILAATHTHAGPGGYWEDLAGERLATGPFDPAVRDAIARAIAAAIRRAVAAEEPARLAVGRARAEKLVRNRDGGRKDARLAVLRLDRPDATPIAELALFPAHPTTLGKQNRALSGDWTGPFLSVSSHGVRLLFQGASGDQSVSLPTDGPITPELYAAALSTEVDRLVLGPADPAPALAYARTRVTLPAPAPAALPAALERAGRNLTADLWPAQAQVAALRLGPVLLLAVPGEPTAEVGARLRDRAGPGAELLSLANGYVGYVEAPAVIAAGRGETRHSYYGPELAGRIERAVSVVADALRDDRRGARLTRPHGALALQEHKRPGARGTPVPAAR
jgi:neutral/alkaline ceramidase-like enzyme